MDKDLKNVLEDLNRVLGRLEKALKSQDVQVIKDAETNIEHNAGSQIEPRTLGITLDQWLEGRKQDDADLIKLRNDFISGRFFHYHDIEHVKLQLTENNRIPMQDMFEYRRGRMVPTDRFIDRRPIVEKVEEHWPKSFRTTQFQLHDVEDDAELTRGGRYYASYHQHDCLTFLELVHLLIRLPVFDSLISWSFIRNIILSWDDYSFRPATILLATPVFQGFLMEYHLRYWGRDYAPIFPEYGIFLHRQHAKIPTTANGASSMIREARISLVITIEPLTDAVAYPLLVFGDDAAKLDKPGKKTWQEYKIDSCEKAIGIVQFQTMICISSKFWEVQWKWVLDEIDEIVRVKLDDTFEEERWDQQMFDTSFRHSRRYFTVLQLLRIMLEWIEGSLVDQKRLRDQWRNERNRFPLTLPADESTIIDKNWDTIISSMELRTKYFLDRINRKTEEVKSLRDGLFNATSLREASKGMALNRAIYVFTVVTVIFTPAGFMATFWALPILNPQNDDSKPSLAALISTFIVIPLLTYMVCLYAIGYFSIESSRRSFNSDTSQRVVNAIFEPRKTICRFLKRAGIESVIGAINYRIYKAERYSGIQPPQKPGILLRLLKFLKWTLAFYSDPSSGGGVT